MRPDRLRARASRAVSSRTTRRRPASRRARAGSRWRPAAGADRGALPDRRRRRERRRRPWAIRQPMSPSRRTATNLILRLCSKSVSTSCPPDGSKVYVSAGGNNKIRVYAIAGETLTEQAPIVLPPGPVRFFFGDQAPYPDGLAISADGTRLYVANNLGDSMSIVNA